MQEIQFRQSVSTVLICGKIEMMDMISPCNDYHWEFNDFSRNTTTLYMFVMANTACSCPIDTLIFLIISRILYESLKLRLIVVVVVVVLNCIFPYAFCVIFHILAECGSLQFMPILLNIGNISNFYL